MGLDREKSVNECIKIMNAKTCMIGNLGGRLVSNCVQLMFKV